MIEANFRELKFISNESYENLIQEYGQDAVKQTLLIQDFYNTISPFTKTTGHFYANLIGRTKCLDSNKSFSVPFFQFISRLILYDFMRAFNTTLDFAKGLNAHWAVMIFLYLLVVPSVFIIIGMFLLAKSALLIISNFIGHLIDVVSISFYKKNKD